jgi:alkylation response protein AidB-like acyl-CoA dehydrogenase
MSTQALSPAAALQTAKTLATRFAQTAITRDRTGGTPKAERDAIRQSGLLTFTIAKEYGGSGGSWVDTLAIIREIARVDSSVAHVFAFHFYQLASLRLYGSKEQWTNLHRQTVEKGWFWANALNLITHDASVRRNADGSYEWNGTKNFSSGATDSDYLLISGVEDATSKVPLIAAIPTTRAGITINNDWDNIGQRQTDSGSIVFNKVLVHRDEVLLEPGPLSTPFSSIRALIGQLVFANLFLSLAEGAFASATDYLQQKEARPWFESLASSQQKDPYILRHVGELWVKLEAARALTEKANAQIDSVWAKAETLTAAERGAFAVTVATAKVATTQIGLELSSRIFELLGARATTAALGFDRFWRNLRTQTLHDPVDYKIHELGDWVLNHALPPPSFYS